MAVSAPRSGNAIASSIIPGLIGALVGCLASFLYMSTSFDGIGISAGAIAPPEQRILHAEVEEAIEESDYEGHEGAESEEEEEGFEVSTFVYLLPLHTLILIIIILPYFASALPTKAGRISPFV